MLRRIPATLLSLLLAGTCQAAHWQSVGPTKTGARGTVYIDLDSVRQDGDFRVALFLTIYSAPQVNLSSTKMDRFSQETAFDCANHQASLLGTIAYLNGKEAGRSTDHPDWKERFSAVPHDAFSEHAMQLVCNSPLAPQPEPTPYASDAPATVKLPRPGK